METFTRMVSMTPGMEHLDNIDNYTSGLTIEPTTSNSSSNMTTEKPIPQDLTSDYKEYQIAADMIHFYTFILYIPGTIGNFIALAVILRKNMRGMSSAVFVAILAVSDNIALLGFLIGMLSFKYTTHIMGDGFCKAYYYILSTGSLISTWTVVAMSFERVLIVSFPLKAPNWTSRTRVFICEVVIIIWALLHNSHFFWTVIARPPCFFNYQKYGVFLEKYVIYDSVLASYVPLILIFIMNAIIIIQMNRAKSLQKEMSNAPAKPQDGKGSKGVNAANQITAMLLTVSIAFFICMLPYGIVQVLNTYVWNPLLRTPKFNAKVLLAAQTCSMLWMVNHSINVVLYSLTGRKFRNEMLCMFTCGKYTGKRKSSKYSSDVTRTTNMRSTNGVTSVTSVSTVSSQAM